MTTEPLPPRLCPILAHPCSPGHGAPVTTTRLVSYHLWEDVSYRRKLVLPLVLAECRAFLLTQPRRRLPTPAWPLLQLLHYGSLRELLHYDSLRELHSAINQHGHAGSVLTRAVLEEAPADAGVLLSLIHI